MKKDAIYLALNAIPYGKVVSYGQLADLAGLTNSARLVGTTLKQLPNETTLAWHRVVNAQRKLSFKEGSSRYIKQKERLEKEGVVFDRGRIAKSFFYDN